ncbi:hypothetical protein [Streptomyces sp. NPDC002666]
MNASAAPAPGSATEDATPAGSLAPTGRGADTGGNALPADGPDTLSGLLAALGRHLESHAPDEVVVLLREEMERRELRAYSSGWRDAAAHYEPALQEARAAGGRALRLVRGVPGQAAVIPLRQQTGNTAGGNNADRNTADRGNADRDKADGHAPTRHAADAPREDDGPEARTARTGSTDADERGGRPPAPALVPKSRSSRVPTIPRLRPPSRRPGTDAAPVAPDGETV